MVERDLVGLYLSGVLSSGACCWYSMWTFSEASRFSIIWGEGLVGHRVDTPSWVLKPIFTVRVNFILVNLFRKIRIDLEEFVKVPRNIPDH